MKTKYIYAKLIADILSTKYDEMDDCCKIVYLGEEFNNVVNIPIRDILGEVSVYTDILSVRLLNEDDVTLLFHCATADDESDTMVDIEDINNKVLDNIYNFLMKHFEKKTYEVSGVVTKVVYASIEAGNEAEAKKIFKDAIENKKNLAIIGEDILSVEDVRAKEPIADCILDFLTKKLGFMKPDIDEIESVKLCECRDVDGVSYEYYYVARENEEDNSCIISIGGKFYVPSGNAYPACLDDIRQYSWYGGKDDAIFISEDYKVVKWDSITYGRLCYLNTLCLFDGVYLCKTPTNRQLVVATPLNPSSTFVINYMTDSVIAPIHIYETKTIQHL